jgi:hypothetical protein
MSSKRQQTMAKIARERAVREKRERKEEKKRARRLAAAERRDGVIPAESETATGGVFETTTDAVPDATGGDGAEPALD